MSDWLRCSLTWLAIGAVLSPVVIGIGWALIERSILPRLVPRAKIEAMADAVMRDHPDEPEEWAFREEDAAWRQGLSCRQGEWHRVRKAIRRRLLAKNLPPAALAARSRRA